MGIFDFLKKLFGTQKQPGHKPPLTTTVKSATPELEPFKHSLPPRSSPISELQTQIKGKGHPQYPFLHKEYSPNSRIPCEDFTSFIIDRLRARDLHSISILMEKIIEANPGFGPGGKWISDEVMNVANVPLEKYLLFVDTDIYHHLKAMWIITAKGGGGREFWLTNKSPLFFALALSPYEMKLQHEIGELCKKANRFIRKMRKDTPYWIDYPLFKESELTIPSLPTGEGMAKVRRLSIGARLHLLYAVEAGGGILPRLTDYQLRSFGLYVPDSSKEIIDSGLLLLSQDPCLLKNSMSRNEMLEACIKMGAVVKKSWNKDKLLQALCESPDYLNSLMAEAQLVCMCNGPQLIGHS